MKNFRVYYFKVLKKVLKVLCPTLVLSIQSNYIQRIQ